MSGSKAFIDTSAIMRLLVKDDPTKAKAVETLIKGAKDKGINLYLLPVTILEIVWVTEKVYHLSRRNITSSRDTVAFYALSEAAYDEVLPELQSFRETLPENVEFTFEQ